MRRRLVLIIIVAGAAAAIALILVLPRTPEVPGVDEVRLSYRVVYEVSEPFAEGSSTRTEVLEVRRPYDSRVELREGAPPGGDIVTGSVTNRRYQWNLGAEGEPSFGLARAPAGAERDMAAPALGDAVDRGLAEESGDGRFAGEECTTYAVRAPYPAPTAPPTEDDRTEMCVTAEGIMLFESWTVGGREVRVTEAVEVTRDQAVAGSRFLIGEEPPESESSGFLEENYVVTENEMPLATPLRPEEPEGFMLDRRATLRERGSAQAPPTLIYSEAYLDGSDLVVVEQGTSLGGAPWGNEGRRVELGELGPGLVVFYPDHVEVRISGGNNFVRVWARSEDVALSFARSLALAS